MRYMILTNMSLSDSTFTFLGHILKEGLGNICVPFGKCGTLSSSD